jgi:hypothetical protein
MLQAAPRAMVAVWLGQAGTDVAELTDLRDRARGQWGSALALPGRTLDDFREDPRSSSLPGF